MAKKKLSAMMVVGLFVLSFASFASLGAVPLSSAASSSAIVQSNDVSNTCSGGQNGNTCSISLAFSSQVTMGNVIVVGIANTYQSTINSLLETIGGTSYSLANSETASNGGSGQSVTLYWATIPSSGTDTVSFNLVVPALNIGKADLYIFEVSGVTTSSPGEATGSGSLQAGGTVNTASSVIFQPGAFLISLTADPSASSFSTTTSAWTQEGTSFSAATYSTSGVSSPTNFPVIDNDGTNWAEVGLALNPVSSPGTSGVPQFPVAALSPIFLVALLLPALLLMGRKFRARSPL